MKECEFFSVSEEGNFTCKKVPRYNRITKEICKEHCPVYEKRCRHLVFSLRKDEVFSALGVGGRRVEINLERAVCDKLKEPIFDIKKCSNCPDFKEKRGEKEKVLEEGDIIKLGLSALIASLGEEKTKEFIKTVRGKNKEKESIIKDELTSEVENWLLL